MATVMLLASWCLGPLPALADPARTAASHHEALLRSLFGEPRPEPTAIRQSFRDTALTPDARAMLTVRALNLDEEIRLVHAVADVARQAGAKPHGDIGAAVPGMPRLGIPALQENDAGSALSHPGDPQPGDPTVPLPSCFALAASWSPALARQSGAMIGQEAARRGFNVVPVAGTDLVRDPRGGRDAAVASEDPLLAGTMLGAAVAGIQSAHVLAAVKRSPMNDRDAAHPIVNAPIGARALRESDLLGLEIALEHGRPGAVMCGNNQTNGIAGCADAALLGTVLKQDWHYPGFVMSDRAAMHDAAAAALAGVDQEFGAPFDQQVWFDVPLKQAVQSGAVPKARLDDMVRRILRSMATVGLVDHPSVRGAVDRVADAAVAQAAEEQGAVLLRNAGALLPLDPHVQRLVVIGAQADGGALAGGGSSQGMPPGASGVPGPAPADPTNSVGRDPSTPLQAIRALAPKATVTFVSNADPDAAAHAAQGADAAIVFAWQGPHEGEDVSNMTLPDKQDALIAAVAAANPATVVVLETGGPVRMPWLVQTAAVLQAWHPGARGGQAIARLLFGQVSPSGRLPVTFPVDERQLPHPQLPGRKSAGADTMAPAGPMQVVDADDTNEGRKYGYKWFDSRHIAPQFPFGFGLSYTRFAYTHLNVAQIVPSQTGSPQAAATLVVSFDVRNTGTRESRDVPQVYLDLPGAVQHDWGEAPKRLIGWQKISLRPGESRHVSIVVDPRLLAVFDDKPRAGSQPGWRIVPGDYVVSVGANAVDLVLHTPVMLAQATLPP